MQECYSRHGIGNYGDHWLITWGYWSSDRSCLVNKSVECKSSTVNIALGDLRTKLTVIVITID